MKRKIAEKIEDFIINSDKILIIDGARQIGKTYIVREVGHKAYINFVEINFADDSVNEKLFSNVNNIDDFYFRLSSKFGDKLNCYEDTLIFIDEIQTYPYFFTLLKFLKEDKKYHFIASGSLLGVELHKTVSIPIGSIEIIKMMQFDFEEFLWAQNVGKDFISELKNKFVACETLDEAIHRKLMDLFKKYLIVGGMPEAIKEYVNTKNVVRIREIQKNIHEFYSDDASKYDISNKLKIKKIYNMIPSQLLNKKKRIIFKDIENKPYKKHSDYDDEFEYLIASGITNDVTAISNPKFPLIESLKKNLIKLYVNDVGIFTMLLYSNNINAILENENSINLGAVYELVVAQELKAHGHKLYYYDNKKNGEVDFLIDDYDNLTVVPIEVKSGKNYRVHSALNCLLSNIEYNINKAIVFSNEREVTKKNGILYMPIYYVMFL